VLRNSVLAAFWLCAALLQGCATQAGNPASGLKIEGLVIENQTRMWVSAARLLVPVTGAFVSCGNISPKSSCATTFPETDYSGNPVQLTWSQAGQIHSTGEFVIQPPEDIDVDRPALVRVVITAPGSAGAVIVQRPAPGDR
jgi:hypothetical protein